MALNILYPNGQLLAVQVFIKDTTTGERIEWDGNVDVGPISVGSVTIDGQPIGVTVVNTTAIPVTFTPSTLPQSVVSTTLSLEATQLLVKAKTDNLDVLLSSRLKPADTLAKVSVVDTITNPVTVTGTLIPSTLPTSVISTTLATAIRQDTGNTSLNNIDNKLTSSTLIPATTASGLVVRNTPQVRTSGLTVLTLANDAVSIDLTGFQSAGGFINASTLVGVIAFEVSADGGATWFAQFVYSNAGQGQVFTLTNPAAASYFSFLLSAAYTNVRVRLSSVTSGSVSITLYASTNADSFAAVSIGLNEQVIPKWSTLISGADGTVLRKLAMKGSSAPALVTDTSAVVALSPNSPLPAGSNLIGSVTGTVTASVTSTTLATELTLDAVSDRIGTIEETPSADSMLDRLYKIEKELKRNTELTASEKSMKELTELIANRPKPSQALPLYSYRGIR